MKQKNFWLRTLNVRQDEGWLVKKLFLLQFLQGAGIAFFFTASFALFLDRFGINELPYVLIYASFLLWGVGFIYSRIEHMFSISKLAIIITIFMAISMLMFRFAFVFVKTDHFLYFMLAWFNVLYLLNNLEFWGISSLLFDARQSKRLFGVISAGDIPAKFIGYSLALLTVEYIGTINLLWAGAVCMLASLPFLISIKKSGKILEVHHPKKHEENHSSPGVKEVVKNFSGNTLIRRLALLSIIVTASFLILNFAFYAGVKEAYKNDVDLAKFIALFLAIVRILALIVKMIFTGRLINKLGIIKSLLITPIVMLFLLSIILLIQNMAGYQKIIVYFFGLTSMVVEILRSAINTPVFLTMMQPLSSHERLRAHTIVKGIMDPFASLLTGIGLLLLINFQQNVDLLSLCYILLAISIFWIIGIYRVNMQYLKTIIHTISSRYFSRENFTINDSGTLTFLKNKIKTGSETEICNILNMLYESNNEMSDELVALALQHPSERVKTIAIKMVQQKDIHTAEAFLLPLLSNNNSAAIIAETIRALCKTGLTINHLLPFLENKDEKIQQATLSGLLIYGDAEAKQKVNKILQKLIISESANERMAVAEILGEPGIINNTEFILQLMKDKDPGVRKASFIAAGKSGNEMLIAEMLNMINTDEKDIIQPLFIAGESALPVIATFLSAEKLSGGQKEKLILLCGRIGGETAQKVLLILLNSHPEEYRVTIKALYRCNFIPNRLQQEIFFNLLKKLLEHSARLIYMQNSLQKHGEKYQLLINSFQLELTELRDSLLYVFAIMYERENINKVRLAYSAGKKESIINAMEIIDMSVRKDIASHFNIIFEPGNISDRMHELRNIYPAEFFDNVEQVLCRILAEEKKPYHYWTTACSLYTAKKQKHDIDSALIKKHTKAENLIVRETAEYAL